MNGYCEPGRIYYQVAHKTAYAKYPREFSENFLASINNYSVLIETGSYIGEPPYKRINKLNRIHREYHCAEHQVYNCFKSKIQTLSKDSSLETLAEYLPRLEEAQKASPYTIYCGTTIGIFSAIALILAALPNIYKFYNDNLFFMLAWLSLTVVVARWISLKIQKTFFLAPAKDHQIVLAIKALKEVLKNE
jgi:hypothetical protein